VPKVTWVALENKDLLHPGPSGSCAEAAVRVV
jgi:hypothetical protein